MKQECNWSKGYHFEVGFSNMMHHKGFWCHRLEQALQGQPADIIAVRDGKAYLIDCKVCDTERGFRLSRIEPNQECAMKLFKTYGNEQGWFAFRIPGEHFFEVYMVTLDTLLDYRSKGNGTIKPDEIRKIGINFEEWAKK